VSELKPCPCGKIPSKLDISGEIFPKYAYASCPCGDWSIEFSNDYERLDSDKAKELAAESWNEANRGG
jgi:hypothetical protein